MKLLELKNCIKIYKKDKEQIYAVNNISYEFEQNKFYVITGNSGSGKTTLLQCMGTLDNFTSGTLKINNLDVSKLSENKLADIRRTNIGFVFQSCYLNPSLSSLQNVMLPLYLNSEITQQKREEIANNLLDMVGLDSRKNHIPEELSGGEQQRVAIARALANNPSIILADEPTGNLDHKNEEIVYKIFKKLSKQGKCVIVVSHNESILNYADIVLKIKDGSMEVVKGG